MKQKLFRGIVLLFLIYTGVELAFPQFCGEKVVGVFGPRSLAFAVERLGEPSVSIFARIVKNPEKTSPGVPREERDMPVDEDCFCCCAHVMPSPLFVNPGAAELALLPGVQRRISIPTAPLHLPYHPPRSA